jgi:hypothetical protein
MDHRHKVVKAFCDECVWARCVRKHFAVLFEFGTRRHELLAEVAKTFFGHLNSILIEYVLLQQCKLTDPASSGEGKENLTSNYVLTLGWSKETGEHLAEANQRLMEFRAKVVDARRKLIAHSDLTSRISLAVLGSFTEDEELSFWSALQHFVSAAHSEAIGGPFEINAVMPDGDAASLVHSLIDAVDYSDLVNLESGFITRRADRRRYGNA